MNRALTFLFALTGFLLADESIQQATEARLWLKIPRGQPPLTNVHVSSGTAQPPLWEKDPAMRNQTMDVSFPVCWWTWKEFSISFTPAQDEMVSLILNGPWTPGKDGTPLRQEILWDGIRVKGAEIENGGFETRFNIGPDHWKPLSGHYLAADAWPLANAAALEGDSFACTWHDRPISQDLTVKAGQTVTITLHAKAATLPGFLAPKLLGKATPAHQAAAAIKRGMNLGNCWEAPPPYSWGIRFTTEDIDRIAAEGFDHIRVPVAWHFYLKQTEAGVEIAPSLLTDLEPVLRRALDKNMHVLLNWHHFNDLTDYPAANRERFIKGWETITRHFKSWPPGLYFELLNEPRDALTTEAANPIYAGTITAIRHIDPTRILFVSPGKWGAIRELDQLRMPDDDDRLVVTVHCYEPFYFTHQKAGWVNLSALQGITYPGPPKTPLLVPASLQENSGVCSFIERYNTLPTAQNPSSQNIVRELLDLAHVWSQHFGRPVHLGEFGAHDTGDDATRARYIRDVRMLAEARGIPWTLWEWKANFGYWDPRKNEARFKEALFGN